MKKKYVKIEGIHCGHCEFKIRTSLMKNKNIKDVSFNSNIACIEYENEIDNSFIIKTINNLDYITKDDYIKEDANKLKDNIKLKEFIIIVFSILLFVFIINKVFGFNIFNMIPSIDSNLTYGMLLLTGMLTSHPIASAFTNYAKYNNISLYSVLDFENIPGIGLKGKIKDKNIFIGNNKILNKLNIKNEYTEEEKELSELGNSIVYAIEDNKIIALIGVKDIVRDNAKEIIIKLKKLNKEIIMLTGDNEETAKIIASSLEITNVLANVMPKEKREVLNKLTKEGKKVMMVGDGINDAPSLASAMVGVSVNSGTDIANDSADVILVRDDLEGIYSLIVISDKTIKNIKQNLFWAFFYNIAMIPVATGLFSVFGIDMNPMIAGAAMMLSSLTVTLNALRLKKIDFKIGVK